MMNSIHKFWEGWMRLRLPPWTHILILALFAILSYGILIPWLGFYWNDFAMNAVALGRLDEARAAIAAGRQVRPDLSLALVRGYFGVSRPAFDARRDAALREAGLE